MSVRGTEDFRRAAISWIEEGCIPKAISRATGEYLYANQAYEELVGYTEAELVSGMDWRSLTPVPEELRTDERMVATLVAGEREEFTLIKHYRHKATYLVKVRMTVRRFPIGGDVWMLVTAVPLVNGTLIAYEQTVAAVGRIESQIVELSSAIKAQAEEPEVFTILKPTMRLAKKYPKTAALTAISIILLVLGDTGVDLIQRIGKVFGYIEVEATGD